MNHDYQLRSLCLIGAFILTFAGINPCMAQSTKKRPMYRTWIELSISDKKPTGLLYQVMDTSILITESLLRADYTNQIISRNNVDYLNIETIKVRRKGRLAKGMLIGTAIGFGLGALIGSFSEDDTDGLIRFTKEDKILMNSIGLGTTGLIIGFIVGSVRIKIPIYGTKKIFQQETERLRKYSFTR